jgi:hypothetical protein
MRGTGGLYSCDEALGQAGFMRGSGGLLRLQSVAEFLAFLPNWDSNLCPTHQWL